MLFLEFPMEVKIDTLVYGANFTWKIVIYLSSITVHLVFSL
jgi:hypothetical protein